MTLRALYEDAKARLETAKVPEAELDARILLEEAFGLDFASYLANRDEEVTDEAAIKSFEAFIIRREKREPLAYITGKANFCNITLSVGPGVLIPRADTEVLVEQAVNAAKAMPHTEPLKILDLCTGSGAIALALKDALGEDAEVFATDVSLDALGWARKNADACGLEIKLRKGDLFEPFKTELFDIITVNPPYITEKEYRTLEPEVNVFEPKSALLAQDNGLAFYDRLAYEGKAFLRKGGKIFMEIGADQFIGARNTFWNSFWFDYEVFKDYAGHDRVLVFTKE